MSMLIMNFDQQMMKRCFELALKAKGQTSPNPLVGCVIVKDEKILSEGYHHQAGMAHAEADAFLNLKSSAEGATLYVNLEPCQHTDKRTPPCSQAIIKHKIKKVVIANLDPNPKVAGKGLAELKNHGIKVLHGVLKDQGENLNRVFFHHIQNNIPYIHLKWAQTLDGYLADSEGNSKWISNELARKTVHEYRKEYDAILIGAGTFRADNPSLTAREQETITKCPRRIIICGQNELPTNHKIFSDHFADKNLFVLSKNHPQKHALMKFDHIIAETLDYKVLLSECYQKGITSILVEGGSTILTDFMEQELYNEISIFVAPKMLGAGLKSFQSNRKMDTILNLKNSCITQLEDNLHLNFQKEYNGT